MEYEFKRSVRKLCGRGMRLDCEDCDDMTGWFLTSPSAINEKKRLLLSNMTLHIKLDHDHQLYIKMMCSQVDRNHAISKYIELTFEWSQKTFESYKANPSHDKLLSKASSVQIENALRVLVNFDYSRMDEQIYKLCIGKKEYLQLSSESKKNLVYLCGNKYSLKLYVNNNSDL